MKPEKQKLLDDLLVSEERRDAALRAGGQILRRRRHWRMARQTFIAFAAVSIVAILIEQNHSPVSKIAPPTQVESKSATVPIKKLTDDELLALFPDTPVALATLPNGRKVLMFLRPADEARFMTHL